MTPISSEQLQFVIGGALHPNGDLSRGTANHSDFKKSFEHHRDNNTPMYPGQQFRFLRDPDNWAGGGGGTTA